MCPRIIIKLPDVPKHLKLEYHPDQVALYSKFTELTFNALALLSVNEFLENLSSILGLEKIEVLVMRLPARRSKIEFVKEEENPYGLGGASRCCPEKIRPNPHLARSPLAEQEGKTFLVHRYSWRHTE